MYDPGYAVPPGKSLNDIMETGGYTVDETAGALGVTAEYLLEFLKGTAGMTPALPGSLAAFTNTPRSFWENLNRQYLAQCEKLNLLPNCTAEGKE